MEENVKYWILFSLSRFSKKRGAYIFNLFYENRPDFINFDFGKFVDCINELEREEYLELGHEGAATTARIKPKGERAIRELSREGFTKKYKILKYIPELEVKDRIENLEMFVFGIIAMLTIYYMVNKNIMTFPYSNYVFLSIFLISFIIAGGYFITISYLVLINLKVSFLNFLYEFIEDNRERFRYILVILLTFLGIFIIRELGAGPKEIAIAIIIEAIIIIIKHAKKINFYSSKLFKFIKR